MNECPKCEGAHPLALLSPSSLSPTIHFSFHVSLSILCLSFCQLSDWQGATQAPVTLVVTDVAAAARERGEKKREGGRGERAALGPVSEEKRRERGKCEITECWHSLLC